MAGPKSVERWFDGCDLPLWIVVHSDLASQYGPSTAVHGLTDEDGDVHLMLFSSEAKALGYIASIPLAGHEPFCIEDVTDLRITLEVGRNKGATHVRIDDPNGRTPEIFCPEINGFIAWLKLPRLHKNLG